MSRVRIGVAVVPGSHTHTPACHIILHGTIKKLIKIEFFIIKVLCHVLFLFTLTKLFITAF